MKYMIRLPVLALIVFIAIGFSFTKLQKEELINAKDPLPSWNDGASKKSIIDFVTKTTKLGGADFVPVADRISCFDNDGTLWSEQPMYFHLTFAIDRIKAMAPQHHEWKTTQPFQALLEGDIKTWLPQLILLQRNITTEMIYLPMVELLNCLRANGYKTCIVSGGGVDFIRPWVEKAYGIPPDQVVGSFRQSKI